MILSVSGNIEWQPLLDDEEIEWSKTEQHERVTNEPKAPALQRPKSMIFIDGEHWHIPEAWPTEIARIGMVHRMHAAPIFVGCEG